MVEHGFTLKLVDINKTVTDAWSEQFFSMPCVEVFCGRFEDVEEFDCIVSPANSFGLMDGGFDLALSNYFGSELADRVREVIIRSFFGEQPIGTCILVPTGNMHHPYLAHAPTMRVPKDVRGTENCYHAMAAILREVALLNHRVNEAPICTVLCPGLGTATGRMSGPEAARQMALAYKHFLSPPACLNWDFAAARDMAVRKAVSYTG